MDWGGGGAMRIGRGGPKQHYIIITISIIYTITWSPDSSLVPRPRPPPGEKRSGERSRIPWAYYPKRVMTNEIGRPAIDLK